MEQGASVPVVTIAAIGEYVGMRVEIRGWMYNKRSGKKIHFLQLRDGSGMIQGIVEKGVVEDRVWETAGELSMESSLHVRGTVVEDPRSPSGYEIRVDDLIPVQIAKDYPISKKEHGVEFLMDRRHLWLRSRRQWAALRVRATVIRAARDYLDSNGFLLVDAPIFTPNACEGTTTLFEVDYFGDKAYLSQSGQLYMEAAAMAHGKVYCFGPTFRAEKSKTRRHLTEFWMVEPEMAYCDWIRNMEVQEEFVCYIVSRVLEERRMELELLGRDLAPLEKVKPPFPRITYDEAVEILREEGFDFEWGHDFGGDEETALASRFDKPVFIHHFPMRMKAFYMKRDDSDPRYALCDDLLAPEGYGEIIGAGQREDDLDTLKSSIEAHGLPLEPFEWYLDLRRYGSVPHAGFGMGVERMVAWVCGLHHLRETIPFPRTIYRKSP